MQDLRERLERASFAICELGKPTGEGAVTLDDAYRIAMEFAREEAEEGLGE